MAPGNHDLAPVGDRELGLGEAMTASGRVSVARRLEGDERTLPFSNGQLSTLADALTLADRLTGMHFHVYLGDLGPDTRVSAEGLFQSIGPQATDSVLIAVSPGQRVVEVVTGPEGTQRITDRGCKLAVMSMVASFKEGDLAGGLASGIRMLADHAGRNPH